MDVTRPIFYRNHPINDVAIVAQKLIGNQITSIDYHAVESVGYREKRSASDGMDAGDVYLGGRSIRLTGTLYGEDRADLYDRLHLFKAAVSSTTAFAESPGDYGYLPLEFEVPTKDDVNWPSGFIPQMIRARAMGTPRWVIDRDRVGGVDDRGFSLEWELWMEARDPRIYAQDEQIVYFNAAGAASSGAGTVVNRGAYPAPLMVLIYVPATVNAERKVTLAIGGASMTIRVPAAATDRIARYSGTEKYLTLEENGVETLRMDLLTFPAGIQHPLIPAGSSSYTWESRDAANVLVNIHASSRFWFWEAWS